MNSIQLCFRQYYASERSIYSYHLQSSPIFTMTQIFKVCQIDHRFEYFGHLFMLLTIAANDSHSDSQTQFEFMKGNQKLMNYRFKANKRTNGLVNAHLRSAAYTNKHV